MTATEPSPLVTVIRRLAGEIRPASALILAPDTARYAEALRPVCRCTTLTPRGWSAELEAAGLHDLAVIDSGAELPAEQAGPLLAWVRDIYARRVLVVTRPSSGEHWSRRAMVGYGFTSFGVAMDENRPVRLYQFDIATYKTTPDWLSPENWANPELWDKYRW